MAEGKAGGNLIDSLLDIEVAGFGEIISGWRESLTEECHIRVTFFPLYTHASRTWDCSHLDVIFVSARVREVAGGSSSSEKSLRKVRSGTCEAKQRTRPLPWPFDH